MMRYAKQVVSQDFWLPAARAVRRMPEREGDCGGLQVCIMRCTTLCITWCGLQKCWAALESGTMRCTL